VREQFLESSLGGKEIPGRRRGTLGKGTERPVQTNDLGARVGMVFQPVSEDQPGSFITWLLVEGSRKSKLHVHVGLPGSWHGWLGFLPGLRQARYDYQ
jgi:hypothetical protein